VLDIADALRVGNEETPAGRLLMKQGEISGRTAGRFLSAQEIIDLPLSVNGNGSGTHLLHLGEVAQVIDGAEEERLRIRFNDLPGIKLSVQKQPQANTVTVVEGVNRQLAELKSQGVIPEDIVVHRVDDQAHYVRNALNNAVTAATSGAILAMIVVYLFLGSLRRTLIIGSAIPIAVLVTAILMAISGLTLNIMTLGGLALGIGMLVDSTIVMLENIYRHQQQLPQGAAAEERDRSSTEAAAEVNSAIVASTSTNLAAVLPFLFITGLVGLLFRELIFTISAAILASMLVALTLVPALSGRLTGRRETPLLSTVNRLVERVRDSYSALLTRLLNFRWPVIAVFLVALILAVPVFGGKQIFLPELDEGQVQITVQADRGINVAGMNRVTEKVEALLNQQPEVEGIFTIVGGFVFGRSQFESPNRTSIKVRLKPLAERGGISSQDWINRLQPQIRALQLAGVKVHMRVTGIRGIRISRGDDDLSLRIKGIELDKLEDIADEMVERLKGVTGIRNVQHSSEERNQELSIQVDRNRAASYGLTVSDVGQAVRYALQGRVITDFIAEDQSIDVLLRLDREEMANPSDVENIVLFSKTSPRAAVRLSDLARVELIAAPASILRERQQRIVEVTASLTGEKTLEEAVAAAMETLKELELPPGYVIYEAGSLETLQEGRDLSQQLLMLALFLVFVVMAVQYESLRNPLVIIISVPFAVTGVAIGLGVTGLPLSMPVWLGLIMLAGIVVNNAIVLVEYIEIERQRGLELGNAIIEAARLRLRPILMTTLSTVFGMLPLALGIGEGSEMLQPLAVTIVSGLLFSTLVSLVLIPSVYRLLARE
jgi:multidrug efflux pump subunit AcrB